MTEDLNYDLFLARNDLEIGPLRPIFNKPQKVAQIDMYTKTDAKPVENFWENDLRRIFTYFGAQSGPKIGPLRPVFFHISKSVCNEHVKQYWCENSENFLKKW